MNRPKQRTIHSANQLYIENAVNNLRHDPTKLSILRDNCHILATQYSFNKGLLKAIERIEWAFCIDNDIERICAQILSNDYIGNRIRRYPLLFKGI